MPNITTERTDMSDYGNNPHREQPGSGVLYWEREQDRKSPKGPDFKGFIVLEMDYKAGEKLKIGAWQRKTRVDLPLLALKEDNWSKKKRMEGGQDKEVTSTYRNPNSRTRDFDDDVPF